MKFLNTAFLYVLIGAYVLSNKNISKCSVIYSLYDLVNFLLVHTESHREISFYVKLPINFFGYLIHCG